jgi:hypothetical protein
MTASTQRWWPCALIGIAGVLGNGSAAQTGLLDSNAVQWRQLAQPANPSGGAPLPVELRLDDGSAEGQFGIGASAARQFLWFQSFRPLDRFELRQVQVLFPPDPQLSVGDPIQIVVYVDPDREPSNGALLRLAFYSQVQHADGSAFSVYPLPEPVEWRADDGDLLIGVVARDIQTGVTPLSLPAAFDGSAAGPSYVATWQGDPPDPPQLPPDQALFTLDEVVQGRWMIRGYGVPAAAEPIPALMPGILAALGLLLAWLGGLRLRRPGHATNPDAQ